MIKKIFCMVFMLGVLITAPKLVVQAVENNEEVSQESHGEVLAGLQPTLFRSTTFIVTANGVRLRTKPSLSGRIIGLLNNGDLVTGSSEPEVKADGYYWQSVYSRRHKHWGWVAVKYIDEFG